MSVGGLLEVELLRDVTVEVNQAEEVETQRGRQATQQPAAHETNGHHVSSQRVL